jgi:hypothetical protein
MRHLRTYENWKELSLGDSENILINAKYFLEEILVQRINFKD